MKKISYGLARIAVLRKPLEFVINKAIDALGIDFIQFFYHKIGILNYQNCSASGEAYLIKNVLKQILKSQAPIIFDVGANTGEYSKLVKSCIQNSIIYSIEPNPFAFSKLADKQHEIGYKAFNFAFTHETGSKTLYTYTNDLTSVHACLDKRIMERLHQKDILTEIPIQSMTLDYFCEVEKIDHIDFVKIDTEGFEYDVLSGSTKMLNQNKIHCIQFEFNEMNIISRVFLNDFYNLLKDFSFYRLAPGGLIALGEYNPKNEIFQFQNIFAVNGNYTHHE